MRLCVALLLCFLPLTAWSGESPPWFCTDGAMRWMQTELGQQKVVVVLPKNKAPAAELVVFLHGDSPFRKPVYQYLFARRIAAERPNAVVASILRPGYEDECGHQSGGDRGFAMGDNYGLDVVTSIASIVESLAEEHAVERRVIMGHSGGAALTGLLISHYPTIAQLAVLVSCPCDLSKWRQMMSELTEDESWLTPLPGLSPQAHVDLLSTEQLLYLVVGGADSVTAPVLSEAYVAAAKARGIKARLDVVAELDHDMILVPGMLERIVQLWPE